MVNWLDYVKAPEDLRAAAAAKDPCEVGRLFLKHLADTKPKPGDFLADDRRLFTDIPTPERFK